jgi:hypothetical protein
VDVTEQARQSGFKLPVAIGDNLFNGYIVPPDDSKVRASLWKGV